MATMREFGLRLTFVAAADVCFIFWRSELQLYGLTLMGEFGFAFELFLLLLYIAPLA